MHKNIKIKCRNKNISDIVQVLVKILFFSILMFSILICFLFSNLEYPRKCYYLPNFILVVFGICIIVGIYKIIYIISSLRCMDRVKAKTKLKWMFFCTLGFLAMQIFAIYNYYFRTDWDVRTIVNAAMRVADNGSMESFEGYFSQYPNNLFLVFCYSVIVRIANLIGLRSHSYFCILVFQCVLCWLSGHFAFRIAYFFEKSYPKAVFAYVLWILLIGVSPWISIPYSDAVALIFPVFIFWIYLQDAEKNRVLFTKWFCIMFFSFIGYKFKPQVFILTFAIGIMGIFSHHSYKFMERERLKRLSVSVMGFFMGLLAAVIVYHKAVGSLGIQIDEEKAFGITHFIMMGMNPEAKGVWAPEDVEFSASFETKQERSYMNLEKLKERLGTMGVSGFWNQMRYKTLINYNDGTFCWGGEGSFYAEMRKEKTSFSPLFRNIYYNRAYKGEFYAVWSNFEQAMWMTVLLFAIVSVFARERELHILMLSIVGISLFELIFEARARYFFIYVPFYIILAVRGVSVLRQILISGTDNGRKQ